MEAGTVLLQKRLRNRDGGLSPNIALECIWLPQGRRYFAPTLATC